MGRNPVLARPDYRCRRKISFKQRPHRQSTFRFRTIAVQGKRAAKFNDGMRRNPPVSCHPGTELKNPPRRD
jgi:hypothetical protein